MIFANHTDPVTPVLLGISIILLAAKFGGDLVVRVRQPAVLLLAIAIKVAAVMRKKVCSLGVVGRGLDRLSGGGMIRRGEAGLIFAAIGQGLVIAAKAVIEPSVYSAIVVIVMVTTQVIPPLLSWSLRRAELSVGYHSQHAAPS